MGLPVVLFISVTITQRISYELVSSDILVICAGRLKLAEAIFTTLEQSIDCIESHESSVRFISMLVACVAVFRQINTFPSLQRCLPSSDRRK